MAAYRVIAVGWSPMPGSDFAGGESGAGRTMSISPLRAQSAVLSKPVLSRSGPCSPYAVREA